MKKRWKIFWIVCGSMFLIGISIIKFITICLRQAARKQGKKESNK